MRLLIAACFILLFAFVQHHLAAQTLQLRFTSSDQIILNPERGLYDVEVTGMVVGRITPYQRLDLAELRKIRQSCTLLFRYFGLKEWRTSELPLHILQNISDDFAAIRSAGLKCIPRFTYSAEIGEPDATLPIILRHIDQLRPILRQNKDVIAVLQAGFIGAWGEWHNSTSGNMALENRRAVLMRLLEAMPTDRMLQVRTPWHKQEVLSLRFDTSAAITAAQAFSGSAVARIGHHNDCFLADASDMGTYWHNGAIDTAGAKAYLRLDNRFAPMGGETCQLSEYSLCPIALSEMKRLRWSFLNRGYNEKVIGGFTVGGCMTEIERRLGYRISALSGEVSSATAQRGSLQFRLRLTNSGWASPFNRRAVELVMRNRSDGKTFRAGLSADPRFWLTGDTVSIDASVGVPVSMASGLYSLFLHLADPEPLLHNRPEYSLRLANDNVWDSTTGWNRLADSILIDPSASGSVYNGTTWFEPISRTSGSAAPSLFGLLQNYPNPFNSSTTISFVNSEAGKVTLRVFDLSGKRVATLYNDSLPSSPLPYTLEWDASRFASGVYVVQLTSIPANGAPSLFDARKILHVK
ncbi:MAG: DUF4832 domain-containing protein [Ignavibacteriae bacterium]|nr:DUF4832 domain-containing protein [Ignavibacteriota bacterium]